MEREGYKGNASNAGGRTRDLMLEPIVPQEIIMFVRAFSLAGLCSLGLVGVLSSAWALTQDEIVAKLESVGYSQIRRVPTGKIDSFKAVKNGKEVSVIVDSTGHVKELQ